MKMVRNGQRVEPTCPACGCRLSYEKIDNKSWMDDGWVLTHFGYETDTEKDARGCRCRLVSEVFLGHRMALAIF